ncbi:MAG: IS110 family transposase [Nitrosomonas sp.]|jgi:transposase|uniref:IS110 family transposase n=1 Tax=Nitrosomonas sp. TaxID=42353 RepID=UPI002730F753|nr:IS110 family transposase [Nitrosomonas sp.]HEX5635728.1 IS110 family transposase [Gammaproteobacteria bacterium]MDP1787261.1 IS110 family transposase [Nitrosomonas sp.]MDP3279940.1 IS110 family transposase [Nitrosomonas sp.]MDP3662894.1 IS110 family transposase [Nitrosomonas sp.]MDZ4104641.1 IS110 family transposase [Nitrosomonas sp.]
MELVALYKRVIGLDVHQAQITACALIEECDGLIRIEQRQFGTFKKDRRALAQWVVQLQPDEVVMESTGIYWKSPYAALEAAGIRAKVVNARHVKNVPGRKTDINDAQWLATLSRAGLLRASFIPPAKMRELRLIARQRQKLTGQLASEKNRLHKILADGGIRLGVVVSDVHGQSARAMIKALIANKMPQEVLKFASRRLKASREELFDALQGELTESHRFVLNELMQHIEEIEQRIARFDQRLLAGLESEHNWLVLLQTLPGVDLIGAAMLLVEIGNNMDAFGSADRLCSWVGICPGNNESAGKHKSGRTRKGNAYVRRLLCEFAHAASRTTSAFKAKFSSLIVRRGYKRAIVALGHKILRTIFFMFKRREHYRDSATDYEKLSVQRNAARWIKTLIQHGFIKTAQA